VPWVGDLRERGGGGICLLGGEKSLAEKIAEWQVIREYL